MKDFNKILYDILLKIDLTNNDKNKFNMNLELIKKYFNVLNDKDNSKLAQFNDYFSSFFDFCFELSLDNMLERSIKFKY